MVGSILKVHLVSANAEAPDDDQVPRLFQNPRGELGLRANTNDMNISIRRVWSALALVVSRHRILGWEELPNLLNEFVFREGRFEKFNLVALR